MLQDDQTPPPPSLAEDARAEEAAPPQADAPQPNAPASEPPPAETPAAPLAEAGDRAREAADAAGEAVQESGSALADVFEIDDLQARGLEIWAWVQDNVLTLNSLIQLGLIIAAFAPAIVFGPKLRRLIQRYVRDRVPAGIIRRAVDALATVAQLIALWITLGVFSAILSATGQANGLISAARSLLTAAIVIRLVTLVIRSPFWSKVAFYVAWPIAALDAFGILDNVVNQLENASIPLGPEASLTALDFVRAGIYFAIAFWVLSVLAGVAARQLSKVDELNASFTALLEKILGLIAPLIALGVALGAIGFDFTSLAIFSGAVGLGIGLGLQKIIGNFLAGFTLLADKSIKPGDTIQVGDTFGWITEMKSRYVSVKTRDGHNHLIPNADFIDNGVVNWSHADRAVRLHAPFGVTYDQKDLRLVQKLAVEAAIGVPRVLEKPNPVCNLMGFGDSSVDFDLRFWINDPPNGMANVKSEVMLRIWENLHEHGIEIPFPQRDLHIRSSSVPGLGAPQES